MSEIVTTYKKNFTTSQKSYNFAIPLSNETSEKPRIDPEVLRDKEREEERKKVWRERFGVIQDEREQR